MASKLSNTLFAVSLFALVIPASADQNAHSLTGSNWLNGVGSLQGKVAIVHFWTFGCINCKHNLPSYARWQQEFKGQDFQIIGVHTPETRSERNLSSLKQFLAERKITYPVLVDNQSQNWDRWNVHAWPTVFLIDKKGRIRDVWEGELEYDGAMRTAKFSGEIRDLLKEAS